MLGHMLSTDSDKRGKLRWCLSAASIAMSALRIGRPDIYQKLGTHSVAPGDALLFLREDLKLGNVDWWFTLFATGRGIFMKEGEQVLDVMKEVGLVPKDSDGLHLGLGQWSEGWGRYSNNSFAQVHERIEQIMQW